MASLNNLLRIGQGGVLFAGDGDVQSAAFAERRGIVCVDAFEPGLLARIRALSGRSAFVSNQVATLGHREIETIPIAAKAIELLLHRQDLFRWLERVSGCATIAGVSGAIARTHVAPGDALDWHNDLGVAGEPPRRLAVVIALDDLTYEGGLFEMRRVGQSEPILSFKHQDAGTMLIFEVSPQLEHRVLPLTAGGPRCVFAGWFTG